MREQRNIASNTAAFVQQGGKTTLTATVLQCRGKFATLSSSPPWSTAPPSVTTNWPNCWLRFRHRRNGEGNEKSNHARGLASPAGRWDWLS